MNTNKEFCAKETEYLGYTLTKKYKSTNKKVQAILALKQPTNVEELRCFLGIVQYSYQDTWIKRSEMLATLTDLVSVCGQTKVTKALGTKQVAWHWDMAHQDQEAFNSIKATIAKGIVLAYPDYYETFEVYTDASATQLGAVINQKNMPLFFFSRKMSPIRDYQWV